jgi:hypothetical protein
MASRVKERAMPDVDIVRIYGYNSRQRIVMYSRIKGMRDEQEPEHFELGVTPEMANEHGRPAGNLSVSQMEKVIRKYHAKAEKIERPAGKSK